MPWVCTAHSEEAVHANGKGCRPCQLNAERRKDKRRAKRAASDADFADTASREAAAEVRR